MSEGSHVQPLNEGAGETAGSRTAFAPKRDLRYSEKSLAIRIFFVAWLIFALHFATNTVREVYPALSLGDHLSFDVSEYKGLHPDIFEIPGRGAFINNNPGASMVGAVPYFLFRPITDRIVERVQARRTSAPQAQPAKYDTIYPLAREFYERAREKGLDIKFGLAAGVTQAFGMAPISALGVVVMFWILLALTKNTKASLLLALLFAFATPIFYRTAQLNQNALLANFALFSFVLLWRPWHSDDVRKRPLYFVAGLCGGWTVVLDYSGVIAVTALTGYAFARWFTEARETRRLADLGLFVAGVGMSLSVLAAYQWSSFGNPFLPAQSYMPPANFTELGYRGFSLPQLDLLLETAFGLRYGLFTSAPLLILAFLVPIWIRKGSRLLKAREIWFVISFVALFFVFCAANQYGRMQFNTGVRHIVPVVPFVFLLVANVLIRIPKMIAVAFSLLATYWSWCLVMYRDVEQGSGIFEAVKHITLGGPSFPWLTTLERMGFAHNVSLVPFLGLVVIGIALICLTGVRRYD
ncbi:MAG: hypothetical protein IT174_17605 [Acidobacteria bacterium]|nr:hypothetical protein [Acidobacteriota bacterium]